MKIAIIGATGQLGTDLIKTLENGHKVIGLTHKDIEVSDYDSLHDSEGTSTRCRHKHCCFP